MVTEPAEQPEVSLPSPTEAQASQNGASEPAAGEDTEIAPPVEEGTDATPVEPAPFDPYEALDREEMKPVLEQRDKRAERELRARLDGEYSEKTRNWEATQTANTLAGYVGNILQKVSDSDSDGMDRSVQSLIQFAQPLMNDFKSAVRGEEARNAAGALSVHMSQSLGRAKDRDAFDSFVENKSPSWQDAFKEYVRLASEERLREKDSEIANLNDVIGRMKAEGRTGQGPRTTGSPGGGGINTYEEASRRYNLPIGHPEKITHGQFKEQRARFGIK